MGDAVAEEYKSSLADLNCNSKPYINFMTILSEENIKCAPQIVQVIVEHIQKVPPDIKLPVLYLIDSIIKNVGQQYLPLFCQNIVSIFTSVFEKVDENTRAQMYKLRQTWSEIFPNKILYSIDTRVKQVDPAWPVTAQPPAPSIHVNPKFLDAAGVQKPTKSVEHQKEEAAKLKAAQNEVLKQLFEKQERLRHLEQKKRELAAKQFLSSQLTSADTAVNSQVNTSDPRMVAKLNPQLSQRDPRLQKVIATALNKTLEEKKTEVSPVASPAERKSPVKETKVAQPPPAVAAGSPAVSAAVMTHAVATSAPSQSVTTSSGASSPAKTESVKRDKKPSEISKPERQKTDTAADKTKSTDKTKEKLEISNKEERHGGPVKPLRPSGKRKRHSEEQKITDTERTGDTTLSPKKPHREKGSRKKDASPKGKGLQHSAENAKESRRHYRSRSRSPLHRNGRIHGKTASDGDTHSKRKEGSESRHREKADREPKGEDTDLRSRMEKELRGQDSEGSKENVVEVPERKLGESKGKNIDDSLLGNQDQDYRQLTKGQKNSQPKGWALYKAAHPDQFKIPLRPSGGNENKRGFDDFKKMGPRHMRGFVEDTQGECDRLGRPRLYRMRRAQRNEYPSRFPPREFEYQFGKRNPFVDKRLHDIFSGNPKDVLRQAEEQYRLGRITENDFREIQRDLEMMWASDEYRRFKEFQQQRHYGNFGDAMFTDHPDREMFMARPDMFQGRRSPLLMGHDGPHRGSARGMSPRLPPVSTFTLDNKTRTIYFIADKAVVFMDDNKPRELVFRGEPTQVFIEGKPITLRFDGKPVEFELDGKVHSMKFGAPSRELYIDNRPYEAKFGGSPFEAVIDGRVYRIMLGGPPPQVQVSEHPIPEDLYKKLVTRMRVIRDGDGRALLHDREGGRMQDLPFDVDMRTKSGLEMNAKDIDLRLGEGRQDIPDSRYGVQQNFGYSPHSRPGFDINHPQGMAHVFRKQEMGQWDHRDEPGLLPPPLPLDSVRHPDNGSALVGPFQDSRLPFDSQPGHEPQQQAASAHHGKLLPPWALMDAGSEVSRSLNPATPECLNMYTTQRNSPQPSDSRGADHRESLRPPDFMTEAGLGPELGSGSLGSEAGQPSAVPARLPHPPLPPWIAGNTASAEKDAVPALPPPPRPPMLMGMPIVPTQVVLPSPGTVSTVPVSDIAVSAPSSVSVQGQTTAHLPPPPPPMLVPPVASQPSLSIDIGTLFDKLLAAGIISKPSAKEESKEKKEEAKKEEVKEEPEEKVPPIELKLENLKVHYPGVVSALYRESQCASCGMRFKEIHGERYSRHLDWHFRMNRREKDGAKKAYSRKWYYEVEDWIQFEEFEDFDERARSFFEMQADEQFQVEVSTEVPSVPATGQETEACVVCGEPFQLFWVEEEEEWHLRNAVRHDDQAYHPSCYEDFKKVPEAPETPSETEVKEPAVKQEPLSPPEEMEVPLEEVGSSAIQPENSEEFDASVADAISSLLDMVVTQGDEDMDNEKVPENIVKEEVFEEEEEEELQGKPGEEEIIGVISEPDEADKEPQSQPDDSEKVVFQSGGIVMKVRAESLKPASPATEPNVEKDSSAKEQVDESEEEGETFRPPTPDPRFKVLPPVQRGTELTGLCRIM